MNRFFIDPCNIDDGTVHINGEDVKHMTKVLRLKQDDPVELCDGMGNDYLARIIYIGKHEVKAEIEDRSISQGEPKIKVSLYQGIPKGDKMDTIVQKSVELGVYEIIPVVTSRTVIKIRDEEHGNTKVKRWQKISREAAQQSKRGIIPTVHMPISIEEALDLSKHDLKVMLWEDERKISFKSLIEAGKQSASMAFFVGPEGGLALEEVDMAIQYGWDVAGLGPRILRTETAGMALLSATMFYMEEMQWA
ncbi:MAG: 16S rRNA (uracil(1498)-N(3))-methyltransferase [Xylanivirga thermophila]|jgi:16S rRNA (uracil1498-N3)-methyltransferase|uniref:16S rRNA (uracil(1498)-N(3))-methyltransferase n=1 Tax=Xylanivirga thermophila TaxID=2496273 RepID=UPI00101DEAD5|nr:16S rRNA (uracil(1498)-N(3))-methyltransferase [Xylanivirga thermophila]